MYNNLQLSRKYLHYLFKASNAKGHGIHSPFVFDLIKNVLLADRQYECYKKIEARRYILKKDKRALQIVDLGAGSSVLNENRRTVGDVARSSLKSAKYAQLLFRMVNHYKPKTIIELGSSLGLTTAYLASGNPGSKVYTLEGSIAIAAIAKQGFEELGIQNIEMVEGDFSQNLPLVLLKAGPVELVFLDGNHRKEPTLEYFEQLIKYKTNSTVMIIDDIHWSREMEEVWSEIKKDSRVTLTIDLFFIGMVFFTPAIKNKQDFIIRF